MNSDDNGETEFDSFIQEWAENEAHNEILTLEPNIHIHREPRLRPIRNTLEQRRTTRNAHRTRGRGNVVGLRGRRVNNRGRSSNGRRRVTREDNDYDHTGDDISSFIRRNLFTPSPPHIPVIPYNDAFMKIKRFTANSGSINPTFYDCSLFGELNELQATFKAQYWWLDIVCPICLNYNNEMLAYTCGHVICYQCFLQLGKQLGVPTTSVPNVINVKKSCTICRCIFIGFSFMDKLSPMILNSETRTYFTPYTHQFEVQKYTFIIATILNKNPCLLIFKNQTKWDEIQKFKHSFMISHNFSSLTNLHVNDCEGNLYIQQLEN